GNGLQTNATLIDDRMAKLFGDYKFLLGCSLDGPSEIHDRYRQNIQGKSSHQDVIRGIEALKRKNVEFNILVLVSKANVYQAKKVYEYLVGKGFYYHQFIPCVEYNLKGELTDFSITGEEWGNFLCEIYDLWYPKDVNIVSIRHFDSILMQIVENISNVCTLGKNCCQYFVVEYNGDIYPCDFFVEKQYKLGNILENTWEEMLSSKLYKDFGAKKTQWNSACENCLYINYCNGDCLKHRIFANNTPQRLSGLCVGWKAFYQHSLGGFNRLAEKIGKHRREATIQKNIESRIHPTSVGRNVLCTCGSGRKYKKCCGK
ncbi:SPASM domain-containing protein, partial [bacterium]|nr:SPASM domain-containing protein [bacterium]